MRALRLAACVLVIGACSSAKKKKEPSPAQVEVYDAGAVAPAPSAEESVPEASKPVRLPGVLEPAPWLEDATRVGAFRGSDGAMRIVGAGNGWLKWFSPEGVLLGEIASPGAALVLQVFDVDGDGISELIVGRGLGIGAQQGPLSLEVLYLQSGKGKSESMRVEAIPLSASQRPQMVAVAQTPGSKGELWAAHFVSKYLVEVSRYARDEQGAWSRAELRGSYRVVGDLSVLPDGRPVIARFYGATADEDGGVYVLEQGGKETQLPSTRGARAVLAMPEGNQVIMADGWHKQYGKLARGLLTAVEAVPDPAAGGGEVWQKKAGAQVAGNYGFNQLRLGDVHLASGPEVIASGNGAAVVFLPSRPDVLFELSGAVAADAFPVQLSGDARMEVVIAGPSPAIWNPR